MFLDKNSGQSFSLESASSLKIRYFRKA